MPSDNETSPAEIVYTPEFKRNIRQLAKKYRHIKSDIQPIINELVQGATLGDQIPGGRYEVFKVRVKNTDVPKGKSGGYRIIYYRPSNSSTVLVTIYSKTEQSDISPVEIRHIISNCEIQDAVDEGMPQEAT